jgi:hypothetical protein
MASVAALAAGCTGCFFGADGREPPADSLYFPTGVLVSPGGTILYVASSDFDLRYSAGTLMALDLAAMRAATTPIALALNDGMSAQEACAVADRLPNPSTWLHPGPCSAFPVAQFIGQTTFIGAFASGLLLTHEPDGNRARLFSPVRGDPSITYFDVPDDRGAAFGATFDPEINCGQGSDLFCDGLHRLGQDPDRNLRGIQLPADPVGIAATGDGVAIVTAHQTQAAASLVINDWATRPELAYFAQGLPSGPTEVASIPEPGFVAPAREAAEQANQPFVYRAGFAVTFRATPELNVLRYVEDSGSVPPRPFIQRESALPLLTNTSAFDSRGAAIVDSERRTCEASCSSVGDALGCLTACAENVPLRIFISNRDPAALLVGEVRSLINRAVDDSGVERITSATEQVVFFESIPLDFGASRVEVGRVVDGTGQLVERIFVAAFDTRRVFVIDPFLARLDGVIRTGRGPHDIGFDTGIDNAGEPFSFMYVGHFTDSYLGVVDLDQRRAATYGSLFANVGVPNPPREGT